MTTEQTADTFRKIDTLAAEASQVLADRLLTGAMLRQLGGLLAAIQEAAQAGLRETLADSVADDEHGDALMAKAREAPHECTDPQCPGDVNRLKLEAYPKLLGIAMEVVRMHAVTSADWPGSDWRSMVGDLAGEARDAIAKAPK